MSRYTISVNDTTHVVDVEEVGPNKYSVTLDAAEAPAPAPAAAAPAPAAAPAAAAPAVPAPAPAAAPAAAAPAATGAGGVMKAPMPGVIDSIAVQVGDQVNEGDTVMVLEAMKMKNDLRSDLSGKVASILVSPGQQVKFGEALISFE